jgi:predicted transcriptional regulator
MAQDKPLDTLFYELASQDRLAILRELCNSALKMQDLARKLDLTATEASRQLQRMSQAKLIERTPEGTYSTTQYGQLLLTLSTPLQVAYSHDEYFLAHDLQRIPLPFINRIGELREATLVTDLTQALERWEKLVNAAKDHVWVMTPQAMGHLSRIMPEKLLQGVKLRSIFADTIKENKASLPSGKAVERKLLPMAPVIMIISEIEGSIAFPRIDGNVDFQSFFGSDPAFMGYIADLYGFYWMQAKLWV